MAEAKKPEAKIDGRPRQPSKTSDKAEPAPERGGPKGAEPTRFGDWEKGGRCFDF